MKRFLLSVAIMMSAFTIAKGGITDSLYYTVRLGYNIGGTAPVNMPATIRGLNKYTLQPNYTLGFDVQKKLKGRWGMQVGLHLENKGMETDATVMNYNMEIIRGGERLKGFYTGDIVTNVTMWMVTIPVMATYSLNDKLHFKLGPYLSYVTSHTFKGHVHDGYLRHNDPTGAKINIGSTKDSRATYDFSGDMRRIQYGVDLGADWRITKRWGIYGDITWGVTGVHKSDFHTISQTLYPIFGTLGVTYKLK